MTYFYFVQSLEAVFLKLAYASAQGGDIEIEQAKAAGDVCVKFHVCVVVVVVVYVFMPYI